VFNFYNIPHLYIDGDITYEARAKITSKFTSDPAIRVLFFSSVGAIGLNLSIANIVIFLVCYVIHLTRTSSDPFFRTSLGVLRMSDKFRVAPTVNHSKRMFVATTCSRMEHQLFSMARCGCMHAWYFVCNLITIWEILSCIYSCLFNLTFSDVRRVSPSLFQSVQE
jgi:hypothetical protein